MAANKSNGHEYNDGVIFIKMVRGSERYPEYKNHCRLIDYKKYKAMLKEIEQKYFNEKHKDAKDWFGDFDRVWSK